MAAEPGLVTPGLCVGTIRLNDVLMHGPAWDTTNVIELWIAPARRFGNIVIPGVPGEHPFPVRIAAAVFSMKMHVSGVYDMNGDHWSDNGYSSAYEGLEVSLDYLNANVLTPPAPPVATIPGELVKPSGTTLDADCQIGKVAVAQAKGAPIARVVYDLLVPLGAFA